MDKPGKLLICIALMLVAVHCSAQPGIAEMQQVRQDLNRSFFSAQEASLGLAALLGIVGAIRIYHNWQMGKDRITTEVAGWFFAAFFALVAGPFLRAIFGL